MDVRNKNWSKNWKTPEFDEYGMTIWGWKAQHHENLNLGEFCDIGTFTYINAKFGVTLEKDVQIGSHCSIYSVSTIDNKTGPVLIKENARVGSHSVVLPGVTIGKNSIIGAFSLVNKDIPDNVIAFGVPVKIHKDLTENDKKKCG